MAGIALTLLGYVVSPSGGEAWKVVTNRVLAILAIVLVGAFCDLSRRRGDELAAKERELQQRADERTAELAHSNSVLEEINIQLRQFAYVASHDLQTPLRGIAGMADSLREDYGDQLDDTAHQYLDRIIGGCKRLKELINNVLAYSRIDAEGVSFRPVDLERLVAENVDLLSSALVETGGEIVSEPLPMVDGDPAQLSQVLLNLFGNALKYRGDAPPRILVSAVEEGDHCVVQIADNGIGIAAEHHEQIFEVFRRLHTQHAYPGTGIGLALCRRIISRHGGRIWVESSEGEGTIFSFTVPTSRREIDESDRPDKPQRSRVHL